MAYTDMSAGQERRAEADPFDCAIVGGGPAGLSAALYLGRLRRSTLVIDDREGRSLWSQRNHNYLGFPDGVEAAELRRLGRLQTVRYGTRFWNGQVEHVREEDGCFVLEVAASDDSDAGTDENIEREDGLGARLGEGRIRRTRVAHARTVIIATGVADGFPEFTGRDECVGKTLFWCTICDGYEALDRSTLVLGRDEEAVSTALQLLEFTERVALVAGEPRFEVEEDRLAQARAEGIDVHAARVADYMNRDGCITGIALDDERHTRIDADRVFVVADKFPKNDLAKQLGLDLDELGYILTDHEQKTSRTGVYAAGDVTRLHNHQVSSAVHEGGMAAAAANYELYRPVQKAADG